MKFHSKLNDILGTTLMSIMCWCGSKLFKRVDLYVPGKFVQGISFSNDKDFIDYIGKYEKKKRTK